MIFVCTLSISRPCQALPELRAARSEGLPVSVETCPHYLHLAAEDIADGATLCKCAPPIRSRENCEALWQGLREGVIDLVATDHSPCPPAMKRLEEGSFRTAWGGISSLSVALSVMWTEASRRGLYADGYCPLDGRGSGAAGRVCRAQGSHCRRATMRTWLCLIPKRNSGDARAFALPLSAVALSWGKHCAEW